MYDYSKLIGRITDVFHTRSAFADAMGMAERTLYSRLVGESYWDQDEMKLAMKLLCIDESEMMDYFFVTKVRKSV